MTEVAARATEVLFKHIDGTLAELQQITVPTRLIVRQSSETKKTAPQIGSRKSPPKSH
jgi:DNA-binding LacI/PurR family transcriptional regulator